MAIFHLEVVQNASFPNRLPGPGPAPPLNHMGTVVDARGWASNQHRALVTQWGSGGLAQGVCWEMTRFERLSNEKSPYKIKAKCLSDRRCTAEKIATPGRGMEPSRAKPLSKVTRTSELPNRPKPKLWHCSLAVRAQPHGPVEALGARWPRRAQ